MVTSPSPRVVIPISGVTEGGDVRAFSAAVELARAGHEVEVLALGFDPGFDGEARALRTRLSLPARVKVTSAFRELAGPDRATSPRRHRVLALLTRLAGHREHGHDTGAGDVLRDAAWKDSPAVRSDHLVPLPDVLRSRAVEEDVPSAREVVVSWPDGTPARRTRLAGDGREYQHDYLRSDGRAFLVEWVEAARPGRGAVRLLDHASGTVRRFADLRQWQATYVAVRGRRTGARVVATSPWADALVRERALRGSTVVRLDDDGSVEAAVRAGWPDEAGRGA